MIQRPGYAISSQSHTGSQECAGAPSHTETKVSVLPLMMSYFTSIFPFFGLVILLIIACLEEGAWQGIKYFFQPNLERLKDITVWYKATEQSFFSLNIAYGSIIMVASYNKFHNNIYRDAIIISVLDTVVNLLAGCVSFAVLGSLSYKYSKNIHEVVDHEGLGLAFIVYPEALAAISYVPQLWAVLFFFMLFVLGVGSSSSKLNLLIHMIHSLGSHQECSLRSFSRKFPKLPPHVKS
ncbi:UNVERIFIED_CONTAM: ine [Trichonephila clavipes]